MPDAPRRPRSTLLSIVALWLIFYASFTLFTPALLDDADSVHAEVAREMLLRHDYVTLYANGIRYLEKAPLLYWGMALSFRLFGVSTAAARFPLALTVLFLALTMEAFARQALHSTKAGLYAALILLSSSGLFLFTRINLPDALVCLWLSVGLYAFYRAEHSHAANNPSLLWTCVFAICCALNVLTKGLIGVVFPVAVVLIYLILTHGWRGAYKRVLQLHPLLGTLTFFAIAAPWHILIALANPTQGHPGPLTFSQGRFAVPLPTPGNVHGWLWFYFVNEHLLRYLNLRVPRDYDTVPLWLFWSLCLVWLMPWSAFVFAAVARAVPTRSRAWWVRLRTRSLRPEEHSLLLFAIWAATPLLFFSLSTRQEYYVLPSLPPLALLIAAYLALAGKFKNRAELPSPKQAPLHGVSVTFGETETASIVRSGIAADRATLALIALGTLFAAAAIVFLIHARAPAPGMDLASLLHQNPADYALSMGHFFDLNAQALGLFRLPLAIAAAGLFLGPLLSFVLRRSERPHAASLALAAGALGFLLAVHLGLRTFAPVLTSQQLAAAIAPQLKPGDLIVIHQEYEYASTLAFYLHRSDLHILEGRSSNLWYGSFFPDAPPLFETPQSLAARWPGPQRIFLWQDLTNQPSPLPTLPGPIYVIAHSGGKEIVSNQPDH